MRSSKRPAPAINAGTGGDVSIETQRSQHRSVSPIPRLDLNPIKSTSQGVNWYVQAQKLEESLQVLNTNHAKL